MGEGAGVYMGEEDAEDLGGSGEILHSSLIGRHFFYMVIILQFINMK
jgi:hypothetical protein